MSVAVVPDRTIQQIQHEFSEACARAGHVQYKITVDQEDLANLNKLIKSLNLEAAALQGKQAAKEAASDEAKN